ncbi:MAG: hypothetical protein H6Q15_1682 [Bacteroidetes bacterium]|nr:hypothetical protein [Bacteroidota bacterium]
MKQLVFVLLLISGLTTYAQDYSYIPIVKPGLQIWTTHFASEGTNGYHYNRFALTDEDTIIEDSLFKKLYWFQDSVFNPSTAECIGGLRENSQKQVFYKGKEGYDNESWYGIMLYDFSLSVGDSMKWFYKNFIVISIDTIEVSGILRRQYSMGMGDYELFKWIEGIGNNQGLLYNVIDKIVTGGSTGFLSCYEYNGELQYYNNTENSYYGFVGCSNVVGLDAIEKDKAKIFVFPNPAKDDINFSCSSMIKDIEIYDIMGKRIYHSEVRDYSKTINISSFNKGFYLAKINTKQGLVSKKFIVE